MMDQETLAREIKREAAAIGFDMCGITTSAPFDREARALADWVDRGYHGEMEYMARNAPRSGDPRAVVPDARTLVVVGLYYGGHTTDATVQEGSAPGEDAQGRISRYAWGEDYHVVMEPRLRQLAAYLMNQGARVARYYVDTGPVIDRAAARRAGLGWYGKNTLIITRSGHGSWVFLGELLTDLPLPPDAPDEGDCGRCRLCLDACPTGAIVAPYVVDARKCISYLTIEHRGPIPRELRSAIGDHIFGCDICQVVCPHNAKTLAEGHSEFAPRPGTGAHPRLLPLLNITEEEFRQRFRGSPIKRTKRSGLRRNVAVALGNLADPAALPELLIAVGDEDDPLVRGHAAWALGRLRTEDARQGLRHQLASEQDPWVREEIQLALAGSVPPEGSP
ncbi:MAG TPA: tRNA epoxyqueuosine(34) reductase QueG [Isosphaeraceae bacterium]|nr:tRNA epoxyqueuosine(34) reductase QueG [Isosphaeraceae bacterium]